MNVQLKTDMPSVQQPGYVHPAGTQASVAAVLGKDRWLIEIYVPDPEGSIFWHEVLDVNASQVEEVT